MIIPFLVLFFLANVLDLVSTWISLSVWNVEMNFLYNTIFNQNLIIFSIFKILVSLYFCYAFYIIEKKLINKYKMFFNIEYEKIFIRVLFAHIFLYLIITILIFLFSWLFYHNIKISIPYLNYYVN